MEPPSYKHLVCLFEDGNKETIHVKDPRIQPTGIVPERMYLSCSITVKLNGRLCKGTVTKIEHKGFPMDDIGNGYPRIIVHKPSPILRPESPEVIILDDVVTQQPNNFVRGSFGETTGSTPSSMRPALSGRRLELLPAARPTPTTTSSSTSTSSTSTIRHTFDGRLCIVNTQKFIDQVHFQESWSYFIRYVSRVPRPILGVELDLMKIRKFREFDILNALNQGMVNSFTIYIAYCVFDLEVLQVAYLPPPGSLQFPRANTNKRCLCHNAISTFYYLVDVFMAHIVKDVQAFNFRQAVQSFFNGIVDNGKFVTERIIAQYALPSYTPPFNLNNAFYI